MEHADAAQVAALVGAAGAVLVLLARDRFLPLLGFALLGLATAGLGRSLVGDDDLELLFTDPSGIALSATGFRFIGQTLSGRRGEGPRFCVNVDPDRRRVTTRAPAREPY